MSAALALRQWVKARQHPLARLAYALAKGFSSAAVPAIPALHGTLYRLRGGALALVANTRRALWDTPLFLSQVRQRPAPNKISGVACLRAPTHQRAPTLASAR